MTKFENAHQVRAYLKKAGFRVQGMKVRFHGNPFGGEGRFFVETPKGDGQLYMSLGEPGKPTVYSDPLRADMAKALAHTNASPL